MEQNQQWPTNGCSWLRNLYILGGPRKEIQKMPTAGSCKISHSGGSLRAVLNKKKWS